MAKYKLKNFIGARIDYDKAIEIDPNSDYAYTQRGELKQSMKDIEGAIEDFNKATEINPKNFWAGIKKAFAEQELKEKIWIEVISSKDKWYVKNTFVSKDGSEIKVWIKGELKNKTINKNGKAINYINVKNMMLIEFDCLKRMNRISSVIYYDSNGKVINESEEEDLDWKNVVPETILEKLFEKVCELFNK